MCLFASFRETKTKKNSEPISTFHIMYDVVVDLLFMLNTHEWSHDLYLDVI
jgi:hypothetical protein